MSMGYYYGEMSLGTSENTDFDAGDNFWQSNNNPAVGRSRVDLQYLLRKINKRKQMAYIGKRFNNLGDVQTLDNITFNGGAGPYNLQQGRCSSN